MSATPLLVPSNPFATAAAAGKMRL